MIVITVQIGGSGMGVFCVKVVKLVKKSVQFTKLYLCFTPGKMRFSPSVGSSGCKNKLQKVLKE